LARLGQLDRAARRDPLEMWVLRDTRVIQDTPDIRDIRDILGLLAIRVFLERR